MLRYSVDAGMWKGRQSNVLDGGAPFYNVYETSDGGYMSIGPIEAKFSAEFLQRMGIGADDELRTRLYDQSAWPALRARLTATFKTKTRDEWTELLSGTDACAAPVLDVHEAPLHPHNIARDAFIEVGGVMQPAPAPRFDRTSPEVGRAAVLPGTDTREILTSAGYDDAAIDKLIETGIVGAL
jgi:alpha-methylacyl-CoA racemase